MVSYDDLMKRPIENDIVTCYLIVEKGTENNALPVYHCHVWFHISGKILKPWWSYTVHVQMRYVMAWHWLSSDLIFYRNRLLPCGIDRVCVAELLLHRSIHVWNKSNGVVPKQHSQLLFISTLKAEFSWETHLKITSYAFVCLCVCFKCKATCS